MDKIKACFYTRFNNKRSILEISFYEIHDDEEENLSEHIEEDSKTVSSTAIIESFDLGIKLFLQRHMMCFIFKNQI